MSRSTCLNAGCMGSLALQDGRRIRRSTLRLWRRSQSWILGFVPEALARLHWGLSRRAQWVLGLASLFNESESVVACLRLMFSCDNKVPKVG